MTSWKVLLGLGVACAACCAIPLLGVAGGLAAFGTALAACADDLVPVAAVLLLAAAAAAGVWGWRRRRAARQRDCSCSTACSTEGSRACG